MTIILKPTHKAVKTYYETLAGFDEQRVDHEMAVRSAFQRLLDDAARSVGLVFIPELGEEIEGRTVRPDGTVMDGNYLPRGYWEAKDTHADLDAEIKKKKAKGYPLTNTIFEDTRVGVLYQSGYEVGRFDLSKPKELCNLLNLFFSYEEPHIENFEKAVDEFKERVPDLAQALNKKIKEAHKDNERFKEAYANFFEICQVSLNPNISRDAVDEMLIQHLLTERVMRKIFDIGDFRDRNVIAREVEKVITALTSKSFSRHEFLKSLDRFYFAIEDAVGTIEDFSEKQHFLNTVYERFFQGYSVKVADTHGIVYTPQPIVDFMCASVEEVLKTEFGKELGDRDVYIIDPATGTGSFIVNLLKRMHKRDVQRAYREQMFANEVMLLPYYIASLNIEHTYHELTGKYEPFEGLCFVDTLDLVKDRQTDMFVTEANTRRIERESKAPITVVIGNPPYNVGQVNENDNNKNRVYPEVEKWVRETYAKDSKATNKNALSDVYVKFVKWATKRLDNRDGIVCFITNNSFVDNVAFDGMRRHLLNDFTRIYHVDLHGNVRVNPKLSGTTHNVFGIQVGVGVTIAVKSKKHKKRSLFYKRVVEDWRKEEKYLWLQNNVSIKDVKWKKLKPDERHTWLVPEGAELFGSFVPLGTKETKKEEAPEAVFYSFSNGVKTNRDSVVYDFNKETLKTRVKQFIEDYNSEVDRYKRAVEGEKRNVDEFVNYDKVKWSRDLKLDLKRGNYAEFLLDKFRKSLYRPFTNRYVFFDRILNEEVYQLPSYLPSKSTEKENQSVCLSGIGSNKSFHVLITNIIPCLDLIEKTQCFPFYVYDEDGTNRRENVTDWALKEFRDHYGDDKIKKWDVFYYVYGLLHHPGYRETFGANLKRDLPRVPFAPEFWPFSKAGGELAELHLNYEEMEPYPVKWVDEPDEPVSYRVEKMRLNKDKTALKVNDYLTLSGIPPEAFEYRLGNRSALDWVIDQYRIKEDKRSGIVSNPNRSDYPQYIVRLVEQVINVSVNTVEIVKGLPKKGW